MKKTSGGNKSGLIQDSKTLRQRAEQKLATQADDKMATTTVDEKKLLHELQVHKIELELQNEALREAKTLIEASRDEYRNRFVDLYDFAPVGYLTVNGDNLITECNLTAASMLGIERGNLILHHFPQWIAPESCDVWHLKLMQLKQNGGKQYCELVMRRGDGSTFIARVDGSFMTSHEQEPFVRLAFTDVSEQKLNEQQLLKSQLYCVNLVESVKDAIITINAAHHIVLFNAAAEKMFGCPADQAIGGTLDRFIPERFRHAHPNHIGAFENNAATDRNSHRLRTFVGLRASGEEFPVELSISQTGKNGDKLFTAILRDISERKSMEQKLHESQRENQFLADLIRNSTQPIAVAYLDGRVGLVNSAFVALTGYSVEELSHVNWATELTPPEWFAIEQAKLAKLHSAGDSVRYEKEYVRKNGSRVPIELLVHKSDSKDKPELYYAFITDITERKLADQEQQAAAKRKDEFLAMLAHELRNPLAPISNAVNILKRVNADPARIVWCTDIISRQLEHLIRLVDDLLDVSRISRGVIELKKEALEIRDFVYPAVETSQSLIDFRRQELFLTLPPEPIGIEGDRIRLTQVMSNIINNAAKYTREGGQIRLFVKLYPEKVCIHVQDNGNGIDANDLKHLFDLFYQADHSLDHSHGGLGIGLFLVHKLVEMHGGEVQAFSEGCDQGSEFVVCLPRLMSPENV